MQVNPLDSLPNAAVETATAKSAEKTDTGSADSFFAQIGQIMNQHDASRQNPSEEDSDTQSAAQSSNDSPNAIPGVHLLAFMPVGTEPMPVMSMPAADSAASLDGTTVADTTQTATSAQLIKKFPDGMTASSQSDLRLQSAVLGSAESGDFAAGVKAALSASGAALLQSTKEMASHATGNRIASQTVAFEEAASSASDSGTENGFEAGNAGLRSVIQNLQSGASSTLDGRLMAGLQQADENAWNAIRNDISKPPVASKVPDGKPDSLPPESGIVQTVLADSRTGAGMQSASAHPIERPVVVDDLQAARSSSMQNESNQAAANKPETPASVALENAGTGESGGGQNQRQNETAASTLLQNKFEGQQMNSAPAKNAGSESRQEIFSHLLSNPARGIESSPLNASADARPQAARTSEFLFQLAERIQMQVRDGISQIRIQLKPDSLGRLEINAETAGSALVARITTDSGSVKAYLESNLHTLQQTLQDSGIKVDRIHIVVQEGFDSQSSSGHTAHSGHAGSEQYEENGRGYSSVARSANASSDVEMAIDPATWIAFNPGTRFHTIA